MSSAEIWIIVSTIIFLMIVYKPAKRATISNLDARRSTIVSELDEAHRLRQEAEALLTDAKAKHASAEKDVAEIVAFAKAEAARMHIQGEADLREHVARREKQALDRIAQAEATALAEVRGNAVGLAIAASREILAQRLAGSEGDRLLDEAIASIPTRISAGAR